MDIQIEALVSGVRFWREFSNPADAHAWARSPDVNPLVVRHEGSAVSLGRFPYRCRDRTVGSGGPEGHRD